MDSTLENHVHTQDNLTQAEEHPISLWPQVPAVSWSASSSHLHKAVWSSNSRASMEMWKYTVTSSGHQHGSWKRGLGLSDGLFTQQTFPAVSLLREVSHAVEILVAVGQGELF